MDFQEQLREIVALRNEFNTNVIGQARDQFERNAFAKIDELLREIEKEYLKGVLKPKSLRYGYISRLIAESDPAILHPSLGGRLMKAEKKYMDFD